MRTIETMLPIVDHGHEEHTRWSKCGRVGRRIDAGGYDDARWNVERALNFHSHLDCLDD